MSKITSDGLTHCGNL